MPLHFEDLDVFDGLEGSRSALIVPCRMCPAITIAVKENKPFLQFFRSPFKSRPFEQYLEALKARLWKRGLIAEIFGYKLYHHWFMCMWTGGIRRKLLKTARNHDAVIVLGCSSAVETVRETVEPVGCKVLEGMESTGIMNARLSFSLPADISFKDCKECALH